MTPMALTSAGEVVLNGAYLLDLDDPQETVKKLGPSVELYIGVVVPERLVQEVLRRLDDAAAEIVGVIAAKLSGFGASSASASSRSEDGSHRARRGRGGGRAQRPRGRQP